MTLLVIENLHKSPRRKLFSISGVDYLATPLGWVQALLYLILGLVLAYFIAPYEGVAARLGAGLVYGVLLSATMFNHTLGHLLGSKFVGAPLHATLITATVSISVYEDNHDYPSRVHLGRAVGGSLFNLMVGLLFLVPVAAGLASHFILFFAFANLAMVAIWLPIPTLDGEVIWRELRHWRRAG